MEPRGLSPLTNGIQAGILNAGLFLEMIIDGSVEFQANLPIQVAHFANSLTHDNPRPLHTWGDPCEILLPSTGHYLQTNIVFTLSDDLVSGDFGTNFLNIIVPQSAISATLVDTFQVPDTNFVPVGTGGYCGARIVMTTNGVHTVKSSQPVGVEVYGFGYDDAYSYFGGVVKRQCHNLIPDTTKIAYEI